MNKKRRDILYKSAIPLLEQAKSILERVVSDEEDALDNIPENLQESERYEKIEDAVDNLNEAVENIGDAIENIDNACN